MTLIGCSACDGGRGTAAGTALTGLATRTGVVVVAAVTGVGRMDAAASRARVVGTWVIVVALAVVRRIDATARAAVGGRTTDVPRAGDAVVARRWRMVDATSANLACLDPVAELPIVAPIVMRGILTPATWIADVVGAGETVVARTVVGGMHARAQAPVGRGVAAVDGASNAVVALAVQGAICERRRGKQ